MKKKFLTLLIILFLTPNAHSGNEKFNFSKELVTSEHEALKLIIERLDEGNIIYLYDISGRYRIFYKETLESIELMPILFVDTGMNTEALDFGSWNSYIKNFFGTHVEILDKKIRNEINVIKNNF